MQYKTAQKGPFGGSEPTEESIRDKADKISNALMDSQEHIKQRHSEIDSIIRDVDALNDIVGATGKRGPYTQNDLAKLEELRKRLNDIKKALEAVDVVLVSMFDL